MRNVLLKIANVISVLIIVFSIVALLTVVLTKPGEAPNFFGYSFFRVMTGSMEPTIKTNSLIVVRKTPASKLKEGDVITFYSRDPSLMGEPNTHRIIRFEEEDGKRIIYTKGDANNVEDRYPTQEEDLIGKVIFSSMGLGKFIRLISNPIIFIPLIVIPLIYMLGRSVIDGIKAANKLVKEEEEAAVREALAELKKKRLAEAGVSCAEDEDKGVQNVKSEIDDQGEHEIKSEIDDHGEQKVKPEPEDQDRDRKDDGSKKMARNYTEKHVATPLDQDALRLAKSWRGRYGVQYRGYKRNQIGRRKR